MKCGIMQIILLSLLSSLSVVAEESRALQQTIRLRGLPDDEVPVVTSLALQPNGKLLATAGDDHTVRLWKISDGRLQKTLRGHRDWVTSVMFCDAGKTLLTGGRDRQVLIWDLVGGGRPQPLGNHQRPISGLCVHEPSNTIAVLGFRAPVQIFDARTKQLTVTLDCPCADTRAIAFSPSGKLMAAGGRNGKLRIWHTRSGRHVDLPGHDRRITTVVFASEQLLLSAGEDHIIHVWNMETGEKHHSLTHECGKVLAMTMLDKSRFAAGTSQNVIPLFYLQDTKPFEILKGHTGSVDALAAGQDQLISGSFDTTVRVWEIVDVESRNQASTTPHVELPRTVRAARHSSRLDSASLNYD